MFNKNIFKYNFCLYKGGDFRALNCLSLFYSQPLGNKCPNILYFWCSLFWLVSGLLWRNWLARCTYKHEEMRRLWVQASPGAHFLHRKINNSPCVFSFWLGQNEPQIFRWLQTVTHNQWFKIMDKNFFLDLWLVDTRLMYLQNENVSKLKTVIFYEVFENNNENFFTYILSLFC